MKWPDIDIVEWEDGLGTDWGPRPGIVCYRLMVMMIKDFITQPYQVTEFRERYKGMIPQLPVDMRRSLERELDRIGAEDGGHQ